MELDNVAAALKFISLCRFLVGARVNTIKSSECVWGSPEIVSSIAVRLFAEERRVRCKSQLTQ